MSLLVREAIAVLTARHPRSGRQLSWALTAAAADHVDPATPDSPSSSEPDRWMAACARGMSLPVSDLVDARAVAAHLERARAGLLRRNPGSGESPRTLATRVWALRQAASLVGAELNASPEPASSRLLEPSDVRLMLARATTLVGGPSPSPYLVRAVLAVHLVAATGLTAPQVAGLGAPDPEGRVLAPASDVTSEGFVSLGASGRAVLGTWLGIRSQLVSQVRGSAPRLLVTLHAHAGAGSPVPPGLPLSAQALSRGHARLLSELNENSPGRPLPGQLQRVATAIRDLGAPVTH